MVYLDIYLMIGWQLQKLWNSLTSIVIIVNLYNVVAIPLQATLILNFYIFFALPFKHRFL